jgi:DNA-binding protein HU-beta
VLEKYGAPKWSIRPGSALAAVLASNDFGLKAAVNAILDALVAGEAVRVSGLGTFDVAARPAREGRNPQTGEAIKILARKAVRFHAGKAVKDPLNPPPPRRAPQERTAPPKKFAVRK